MLAVMVVALAITGFLAYKVFGMISGKIHPVETAPAVTQKATTDRLGPASVQPDQPSEYDYAQFIHRISSKPESAPAYDGIRQVQAMPMVAGGACMGEKCKCYTGQGSDAGLSSKECREWIANPPFNPYLVASSGAPSADTPSNANQAAPVASSGQTVYGSGPSPSASLGVGVQGSIPKQAI